MRPRAVRILCGWGMLGTLSVALVADTTFYWVPDFWSGIFRWNYCLNWKPIRDEPATCYPLNSVQHHATIPYDNVTYIIYLTRPPTGSTNSFGNWLILDDVTLRNGSGAEQRVDYLVKSLEIQGGTNGTTLKIEKAPAGTCDNCCLTVRTDFNYFGCEPAEGGCQ